MMDPVEQGGIGDLGVVVAVQLRRDGQRLDRIDGGAPAHHLRPLGQGMKVGGQPVRLGGAVGIGGEQDAVRTGQPGRDRHRLAPGRAGMGEGAGIQPLDAAQLERQVPGGVPGTGRGIVGAVVEQQHDVVERGPFLSAQCPQAGGDAVRLVAHRDRDDERAGEEAVKTRHRRSKGWSSVRNGAPPHRNDPTVAVVPAGSAFPGQPFRLRVRMLRDPDRPDDAAPALPGMPAWPTETSKRSCSPIRAASTPA